MSNDHNKAHSFGYSAKCRKGHKFCGCTAIRDGHGVWCPVCGEDVSEDKSNTARK